MLYTLGVVVGKRLAVLVALDHRKRLRYRIVTYTAQSIHISL